MSKIRSFVRREGRMTPAQKQAIVQFWPRYGVDYAKRPLELPTIFEQNAPLIVEIGFGMGDALLEAATQHPDRNYLGIEVYRPGVGRVLSQLAEQQLTNVRVINHDAVEVIQSMLPDNSVTEFWIFFPDPWPKKRHHKRRLIQPELMTLLLPTLQISGHIHCATDWAEYAEQMLAVLSAESRLINEASDGDYFTATERPTTKFQRRGERLGHGVWDLRFTYR